MREVAGNLGRAFDAVVEGADGGGFDGIIAGPEDGAAGGNLFLDAEERGAGAADVTKGQL